VSQETEPPVTVAKVKWILPQIFSHGLWSLHKQVLKRV